MRKSLLEGGLLGNAVYNINQKNPDIKFFNWVKFITSSNQTEAYLDKKGKKV